eukprot:PLAT3998.1.p1 GENE.PLAT3998.1~~PLAT3998.1.p1  ORF type:complete len:383 (+),score=123.06 PLAT3998.1:378-1526(+)
MPCRPGTQVVARERTVPAALEVLLGFEASADSAGAAAAAAGDGKEEESEAEAVAMREALLEADAALAAELAAEFAAEFAAEEDARLRAGVGLRESLTEECKICMDDVPVRDLVIASCGHNFCNDCVQGYLTVKIKDGQVMKLVCPAQGCERAIRTDEVEGRVTDDVWDKFQRFSHNYTMSCNPNARWCQAAGCENAMIGDAADPCLVCDVCGFETCFNCSQPWHEGKSCEEVADTTFADYSAGRDVQPCPRCRFLIERAEGCNHMTCVRCGHQFCWLCRARYTSMHYEPYNIFGCPGLQNVGGASYFGDSRNWGCCKRCLWRLLVFIVTAIAVAVAIPCAVLFCIFCWTPKFCRRLYRHRRRVRRRRQQRQMRPVEDAFSVV